MRSLVGRVDVAFEGCRVEIYLPRTRNETMHERVRGKLVSRLKQERSQQNLRP